MTATETILAHFREQAAGCREYGSPFTGAMLDLMGDDLAAGGEIARLVGDWPGPPRADALSLRLAGALHAGALQGKDKALAAAYAALDPKAAFAAGSAFFAADPAWARAFIAHPPQTNETRRSIGLLLGFLAIADRYQAPLHTLELGASAGLNLMWDAFGYAAGDWRWGDAKSPVQVGTAWEGPAPIVTAPLQVASRAACDANPIAIADPETRLRLKAYIWPDQPDRLARFDAAVTLALAANVQVARADAGDWLEAKLAARPALGVSVVYHSVFYQYPTRETQARIAALIEAAGASATEANPLCWLRLEPEPILGGPRDSLEFLVDVIAWPGARRTILGRTDGHVRGVRALTARLD